LKSALPVKLTQLSGFKAYEDSMFVTILIKLFSRIITPLLYFFQSPLCCHFANIINPQFKHSDRRFPLAKYSHPFRVKPSEMEG
jgi:hypothetical protein